MTQAFWIEKIGLAAAIGLPLFNIPLIVRICRRKSSKDISLVWALGVWSCLILMAPSGFTSKDLVWKTFNFMNLILFSCVALVTLKYRQGRNEKDS